MKTIILITCLFVAGNAVAEDYFSYENQELRSISSSLSAIETHLMFQEIRERSESTPAISTYQPSPEEDARWRVSMIRKLTLLPFEKAFKRAYWDARLKVKDIR